MSREREIHDSVRRELALEPAKPLRRRTQSTNCGTVTVQRVVGLAALLCAVGSGQASAQAPYQQELVPGFSSLFAGPRSKPKLVDLDGDGDLDSVVGGYYGTLGYFENTGSSMNPFFVGLTGAANPFTGIDVQRNSAPDLVDLDGDGDLDAIVGNYNGGFLRYFENKGSSTSASFLELTGVSNPFSGIAEYFNTAPELVDLDGDGDLDAAVGTKYGTISYYENTGTSSTPSFTKLTGVENPFSGLDVGEESAPNLVDLDGDGDLDAIVGELNDFLHYLENTGTSNSPSFVQVTGIASPFFGIDLRFRNGPDLVDLDDDGDLDAIVGEYEGILHYLENTGNSNSPSFVELTGVASRFSGVDVGNDSIPSLTDVDGDGDLDAVMGDYQGYLRYFENTGAANYPSFEELTGGMSPFFGIDIGYRSAPDLTDLDGDGDLDAVVGEKDGILNYFENTGTSNSPSFEEMTGGANPFFGIDVGRKSAPDLADLDGDGDLDAVVGEFFGSLDYFENTGTSNSPFFRELTGSANPFFGIDVVYYSVPDLVDLDGDGDLDAVVGESDIFLRYFQNTGTSNSPSFVELTGASGPFSGIDLDHKNAPDLVDLDGDGDLDAVVGGFRGALVFLRSFANIFSDGFEDGDTTAWSAVVPPP
ncbi:MAG: FG-GAP-like repeat-containing protein [Thermoanaerobaculia bacterium]|nr:FG-GAP-like repeat-containing protein [Thermoanaerobaculia bacterium]